MSTGGCNLVEMKRMVNCYRRKSGFKNGAPGNKCGPGNCCFLVPKTRRLGTSPLRFLRNLRDTAVTALCMVSLSLRKKPSPKISSLVKSTPSSDSHRSESVEACIKYINSSSTSSSSSSSSSHSESNPNTAVPESG